MVLAIRAPSIMLSLDDITDVRALVLLPSPSKKGLLSYLITWHDSDTLNEVIPRPGEISLVFNHPYIFIRYDPIWDI